MKDARDRIIYNDPRIRIQIDDPTFDQNAFEIVNNGLNSALSSVHAEPRKEAPTGEVLTTASIIRLLFNNCRYKSREDQRAADKIYVKLEDVPADVAM